MLKAQKLSWTTFEGCDLAEEDARGELDVLVPSTPGIYAWRRSVHSLKAHLGSAGAFANEIERFFRTPLGRIGPRALAHFVWLDGLQIGGSDLPDGRTQELRVFLQNIKNRRAMLQILSAAIEIAPPLYVGETENLRRRTKEHLTGQTQFAERLFQESKQTPSALRLSYIAIGDLHLQDVEDARSHRTLSELLIAKLTLATLTSRPG
jgi:hypothetical protein